MSYSLDPFAILAALGVTEPDTVRPVSGGYDTAIWRVEHGGQTSALRVFRPEQARVARREVQAMQAAADGGLPVPRVRAEGVWQDRPALLLEWCPGRPLSEALGARPWRAYGLGITFGETQARLHAIAPPADFDQQPAVWINWAGAPEPALAARLQAIAAPPALLHLDYHPLNVMTDGHQITAVLDWANARAGDPRADLARTVAILRLSPVDGGVPRALVRLVVRALEAGWRRGYRQVAGPVRDLAPFYAWAGEGVERDLAPKAERVGLSPADLARIRRWTATWRQRVGLSS